MAKYKKIIPILPIIGIVLYCGLYILAATYYPGGSYYDLQAEGFDWVNNYWCDLLGKVAKNGMPNTARPIAIAATFLLCISLTFFWYILPLLFNQANYRHRMIQLCGIGAMIALLFLFTPLHNQVINLAAFFALIALSCTFMELYQNHYFVFLYMGIFCLIILCFNFFIYHTEIGIELLPLTQKVAFIPCFFWIIWIAIYIYKEKY